LTDALQELELLLLDEDERIPYRVGDSFYSLTTEEATERIESEKGNVEGEIGKMKEEIEIIKEQLNKLKVQLYGKFGNSINLDK
jgi:chaperonin cofactor prefoldin